MSLIYSLKVFQVTGTQIAGFDRALAKTDWCKSMEGWNLAIQLGLCTSKISE